MGIKEKRILNLMFREGYRPLTFEGLQKALNVKGDREIRLLYTMLEKLENEGSIVKTLQGRYSPLQGIGLLLGRIQAHFQGYAFLIPEALGVKDVFIPPDKLGGAMHGDQVIVRVSKGTGRRRQEGVVTRVLSRHNRQVVGTFEGQRGGGSVIPDDRHLPKKIKVVRGKNLAVRDGYKVLVQITRWPDTSGNPPQGRIVEVFGAQDSPGVDITSIQRKHGIPLAFPDRVLKEAGLLEGISENGGVAAEERLDLTGLPMVTIDGADAKDLDDAVSLEKVEGGYRLGVHIADVSYFIKPGSALDREASQRATSVYLPDRVIPMLPPQLSNGICSLNPGDLRQTISVLIDIDHQGRWQDYTFSPSFITVDKRMIYDEVNGILGGDEVLRQKYADFTETFEDMAGLAKMLKMRRMKRGALDFNLPEAKIILDEEGRPLEIRVVRGGQAESIIEEFMLLCNEIIAAHFQELKVPFIYRVHERPEGDKLFSLKNFLWLMNISSANERELSSPKDFQKIMEKVKGTPKESVINYVMLRTMPQAIYSDKSLGHFGLATRHYTHFTAPIRRYPDLMIHRILRLSLNKRLTAAETRKLASILPKLVQHCSEQERIAMEAERECVDLKKVEYMEGCLGEVYEGIISGVTSFGFFVELPNTVEGLVRLASLSDDSYYYDEKSYSLIGERTAQKYSLGDAVRVQVERVDKEMRTVYFALLK
ncbi:MAG TPA: ribonuclease R [Firmicutes bacterium]|nr:ribonuclease R [Bacillota bacterium]